MLFNLLASLNEADSIFLMIFSKCVIKWCVVLLATEGFIQVVCCLYSQYSVYFKYSMDERRNRNNIFQQWSLAKRSQNITQEKNKD